ncbi:MAG: AMP-binding protein [Chloroflexi bacterium]|nr:AMP-binding protein [Chloroflexota bacterium]
MNIAGFLSIPASMFPEQEALVYQGRRFAYGQVAERAARLAGALRELGVRPGTRVATMETNSARYVEMLYAIARLGGVIVPLNFRAKVEEVRHMLATADVALAFGGQRYLRLLVEAGAGLVHLRDVLPLEGHVAGYSVLDDALAHAEAVEDDAEVADEDLAVILYTSGTTALPKGVMLTHGDFSAFVFGTVEPADGTDRGATLLSVPLHHVAGLSAVITAFFGGRRLVALPQFEPTLWLETAEGERITHAFLVPTMLKRVLDEPDFAQHDLSSLQILSYGAAPMPLPVIRRAIERFPKTVGFINAFGQTETTSTVAMLGPDDHRLAGTPAQVEQKLRRLASIGRPLADVELRVVDDAGCELLRGQIGEIAIRSERTMRGYLGQEDATRATIDAEGWLRTRDLGWMDADGYVFLAGRKSDVIIRGGENIAPDEVEAVLYLHPAVEDAAVVGVPDEEWGERVAAAVVPRAGAQVSAEELVEFCRQRLASFKKPEVVRFVGELPRNPMGKVLRRDLRTMLVGANAEED